MSQPSSPIEEAVERAIEAFVYAPIGLAFDGPDPFPALVEKGRNQVTAARMMGEFAVRLGQGEACKLIEQVLGSRAGGATATKTAPARARPAAPRAAPSRRAETNESRETDAPAPTAPVVKPDLAIPDYDGLSASQVVTRLGGLSPDELEAVRRHEAANRGRKTILNKVAQIQA